MLQRCVVLVTMYLLGIAPPSTPNVEGPEGGKWLGKLTQEQGGYRQEYDFELYLVANKDNYTGRTYVYAPNVLGVLSFTGQLRGAVLYLKEQELLISRKPSDLSWCFKTMQPGWLSLKYIPPQV
jgi:hypothetical protein